MTGTGLYSATSCCRRRPGTRSTTYRAPTCTRSCTRSPRPSIPRGRQGRTTTSSRPSREVLRELAASHLGTRDDLVAARCCTTRRTRWPCPEARQRLASAGSATRSPGRPCRSWPSWSATTPQSAAKMSALGPLVEQLGTDDEGRELEAAAEVELLAGPTGAYLTALRRATVAGTDVHAGRGHPGPVRHHQRPGRGRRASGSWRSAPAQTLADLAETTSGKRISFADTQVQPRPVITWPEWSGSEHGGRRYTAFAINVER